MSRPIASLCSALMAALVAGSCVDLDFTIHNPLHCSDVGPETCDVDEPWGKFCVPCDEAYDWAKEYPWVEGAEARAPAGVEQVRIPTRDGKGEIDAYFLPAHGDRPDLAGTTLVYFHGNHRNMEHYLPRARFLHEAGYTVFAVEHRGYGKSDPPGAPTAEQFFDDAEEARARLEELGVDLERVAYYGHSLGALPAVELALRRPPCALLLEAPFPSVDMIVNESSLTSIPASFLGSGDYDNERKLGAYEGSVYFMHGEQDDMFSPEMTERLSAAAPGPKRLWLIKEAGHGLGKGIVETAGTAEYFSRIERFLEELAPACLGR